MSVLMLLVLLSVGGSTVLGVFGGLLVRRIPHRFNDAVLGYAAGVMLAAAVLGLLAPAFEASGACGLALALGGTLAGAAFISVLDRIVPHLHHLVGLDTEEHRTNRSIGKTLLFVSAIALHKIPEGLATGVSFGTGVAGDIFTVAGAISLQNVPEAVVIVAPLFAIGVSTGRVIGISFAIAALSMASVLCGSLLVSVFASVLPFMLAAAGGAMLYVVSDEMIPETHAHGYEKPATFALIGGLLSVVVIQRLFNVSC
ncbi:MAG: ZIP family metal transporter [Kiritimatiellia bacterium]